MLEDAMALQEQHSADVARTLVCGVMSLDEAYGVGLRRLDEC